MESDDSKTIASLGQALSTIRPTLLKKQIIGALETEANEQQAKRWSPSLRREVGSATTFLLWIWFIVRESHYTIPWQITGSRTKEFLFWIWYIVRESYYTIPWQITWNRTKEYLFWIWYIVRESYYTIPWQITWNITKEFLFWIWYIVRESYYTIPWQITWNRTKELLLWIYFCRGSTKTVNKDVKRRYWANKIWNRNFIRERARKMGKEKPLPINRELKAFAVKMRKNQNDEEAKTIV